MFKDCEVATGLSDNVSGPTPTQNYNTLDLALYFIYSTQGLMMFFGGGAIALSILSHVGLRDRKENIIILALTSLPACEGLAYLFAAIYRIPVLLALRDKIATTKLFCALLPYNILWLMFGSPSALALCALSCDRLLLIVAPLRYLKQGAGYGWLWFAGCYLHGLVLWLVSIGQAWSTRADCDQGATLICWSSAGRSKEVNAYHLYVINSASFGSIVLLLLALGIFRWRNANKIGHGAPNSSQQSRDAQMEKERRLTNKVVQSTVCTLVLYVIPATIDSILAWYDFYEMCDKCELVGVVIWITANFNPLLNVYIFLFQHREIRIGFWAAIQRKHLSPDVNKWEKTSMRQSARVKSVTMG